MVVAYLGRLAKARISRKACARSAEPGGCLLTGQLGTDREDITSFCCSPVPESHKRLFRLGQGHYPD